MGRGGHGTLARYCPADGAAVMNGCCEAAGGGALQRADWLPASAVLRRVAAIKMQSFVLEDAGWTDMIYGRARPDAIL